MIGIISFPGSNGDADALFAMQHDVGVPARLVDYRELDVDGLDGLILPGGFSYGDSLRCGAIARFAPVMTAVQVFARRGGPVLGICNGFQILTEAHLLPGALLRNRTLTFHSRWTSVLLENTESIWTRPEERGRVLSLPVAHGEGAYYADATVLDRLEAGGQVFARYCDDQGNISHESNFNGSSNSIAGIQNESGNVVGLMPHPERAASPIVGGSDGLAILGAVLGARSDIDADRLTSGVT